ncbi:APC family permease [Asticcacaulis sp. AC402]|uniref:APC family permease n=1 Tax=Asticcacaulis sp. AC402 TaxID=1282361 RepID=UPI0003C3ED57|nr:APC family permease [Asticcacaulis sp. AC402]ESQ76037.1 hypothetical protein ABAC402_06215 [Asticcacaulis sp. AC402]
MDSAKKVGLWDIVLYATAMNFGIRWLATGAATGPVAIPIWIAAAILFLVPLSLATMALSEKFPGEGAIYAWTRDTMGPFAGFLCGWIYWACNLPFFAALLVFVVNLVGRAIGGEAGAALTQPTGVLIASTVTIVVIGWLHSRGIGIGKWLSSAGAVVSILLLVFLIGTGFWLAATTGPATDFAAADYLPELDANAAILWATMVFAYGGAEGVALLRSEARGGVKTIVTALIMVGVGLAIAYALGTAAMLMILPQDMASRLDGLPGALGVAAEKIGLAAAGPWLTAGLALVMLGGLNAWFGVSARLPFAAGIDHVLPPAIGRQDPKTGAPYVAIWLQTALVVIIMIFSQAGVKTLAGVYDFIVAMSTFSYTLPFLFLFGAWWVADPRPRSRWIAVLGFIVALSGVLCSFVPSEGDWATTFKLMFAAAVLVLSGAAIYGWYLIRRPKP